ncbi:4-oxalocrotonate tautomerase [Betaproteobacteria bacterium GR16-43]|nr:4-oxalocrotonate tautomerase [Betaproteobacteria bacterium GR16-43]
MPLTLIVTEGVIPKDREADTMARLSETMLKLHGLTGNKAMTPNVIGSIQVVPKGSTFAGLKPTAVAIVEWKVPAFAFTDREIQKAYVAEATEIVHEASGRRHSKDFIWVNVTHAVDGIWGSSGKAHTNAELGAAVALG